MYVFVTLQTGYILTAAKRTHVLPRVKYYTAINEQMTVERKQLFINYQQSYTFRPREIIFRLALKHFKRSIQIALQAILIFYKQLCSIFICLFLSSKQKQTTGCVILKQ